MTGTEEEDLNEILEDIENRKTAREQIEEEEKKNRIIEFQDTGSDIFNLVGGGGVPWGKIINIVGDESTGKTALVSEIIARAKQEWGDDLIWCYDDAESGYSFDSKSIWEIDIVGDELGSETLEEFSLKLDKKIKSLKENQRLIYALDSLDGLTTEEELQHYDEKLKAVEKGIKIPGTYGQSKAKGTSEFLRVRTRTLNKRVLLIIISQVRSKIGVMFGSNKQRIGGKALDFYAAQVFWLAVAEKHEQLGRVVGVTIKIKNTKNKVGKPYRTGFIDILIDYGIDRVSSNIKFLYNLLTEKGKMKNIEGRKRTMELEWDGKTYSLRSLVRYIEKNDLEDELRLRTIRKWNEIEDKINTSIGRKPKFR